MFAITKTSCAFIPTEMVGAGEHDSRVDVWCLGVLLFEMLASYVSDLLPYIGTSPV